MVTTRRPAGTGFVLGRPRNWKAGQLALVKPLHTVANCAFLVLARKWYSELTQEGIREFLIYQ
jgi:hypothetical protein